MGFFRKAQTGFLRQTLRGAASAVSVFGLLTFGLGADGGGCSQKDVFQFLEVTSVETAVTTECAIASSSPSGASIRIAAAAGSSQNFAVTVSGSDCSVSWALNGVALSGSNSFVTVASSDLVTGSNTLEATVGSGATAKKRTWTISKNAAPTCGNQNPVSAGNIFEVGTGRTLSVAVLDTDDNAPASVSWRLNGLPSAFFGGAGILGNVGSAVFTPLAGAVGSGQTISAVVSDGYDSVTCSWSLEVRPVCTLPMSSPAAATVRVSSNNAIETVFGVSVNHASCALSWSLNSSPLLDTGSLVSLLGSQLSPGVNTISVSASNGVGAPAVRSWTVTKNQPPSCSAQTPGITGTTFAHTSNQAFSGTGRDEDGDNLTPTWKFQGAPTALITATGESVMTPALPAIWRSETYNGTFDPTVNQVGSDLTVAVDFFDGLETGSCSWVVTVSDPSTVQVTNCAPSPNPVIIKSEGVESSKAFTVTATGTGLSYAWRLDGNPVGAAISGNLSYSASELAVATHTLVGEVTDSYSNSQSCTFTVKRNAKPVLSGQSPAIESVRRVGATYRQTFSLNSSDLNSDVVTYQWLLDGAANPALTPGAVSGASSSAELFANGAGALLGSHVVSVIASDGHETATTSWNVEINRLSDACNEILNGTVNNVGGRICTLAGDPIVGNYINPDENPSSVRISPEQIVLDSSGNRYIPDSSNHVVWFHNLSGSEVTKFGKTVPAGQMVAIIGNGALGNSNSDGIMSSRFKLYTPRAVAYDEGNERLYVADYNNDRVVMMNADGSSVTTVLGGGAIHTDGNPGTNHACSQPSGLAFDSSTGDLYVSCHGSHLIKRLDTGTGNAYVAVGRLTAGGAPIAANGTNGAADGSVGPAGEALVVNPWALALDSENNLYWTERNTFFRVRAWNRNASASKTFYSSPSIAGTRTFYAVHRTTGTALTVASMTITAQGAAAPTAPATWRIAGPANVPNNICTPFRAYLVDAAGTPVSTVAAGALALTLATTAGTLYKDSGCTQTVATVPTPALSAGDHGYTFYFKHTATATLTASGGGLTASAGFVATVAAPTAVTSLGIVAQPIYWYTGCLPILVQLRDASARPTTSASATIVQLSKDGIGNFYAAGDCSGTPQVEFTIAAGLSQVTAYYKTTNVAPANSVVSLMSGPAVAIVDGASVTGVAEYGVGVSNDPRGIALVESSGTLVGMFIGSLGNHRVQFLNFSGSNRTYGGITVAPGDIRSVVGNGQGSTDNVTGYIALLNQPSGVALNGSSLLIADLTNGRIRSLDTSNANSGVTGGIVTTVAGQGRIRGGNSTGETAVRDLEMSGPVSLAYEPTSRSLFVGDYGNFCIRKINLLTGVSIPLIGLCGTQGTPLGTVGGEAPEDARMRRPVALSVITSGGRTYLLYADVQETTGQSTSSLIRAYNLALTDGTLFGTLVKAGKVATVAGNLALGSGYWQPTTPDALYPPNTNGSAATSVRLYNPTGMAYDGSNLYLANYNDESIVKITAAGAASRLFWNQTLVSGGVPNPVADNRASISTAAGATVRHPRALALDPASGFSGYGNLFLVDSEDLATSRLRYINNHTSALTILGASSNVNAALAGDPYLKSIANYTPVTGTNAPATGRLTGVAAFENWVCFASGYVADVRYGASNVKCLERHPIGTPGVKSTKLIGPDETSTETVRAGSPMGEEQENIPAGEAFLNSPYGLTFDGDGNLYIADRGNHLVRMVRRWW